MRQNVKISVIAKMFHTNISKHQGSNHNFRSIMLGEKRKKVEVKIKKKKNFGGLIRKFSYLYTAP